MIFDWADSEQRHTHIIINDCSVMCLTCHTNLFPRRVWKLSIVFVIKSTGDALWCQERRTRSSSLLGQVCSGRGWSRVTVETHLSDRTPAVQFRRTRSADTQNLPRWSTQCSIVSNDPSCISTITLLEPWFEQMNKKAGEWKLVVFGNMRSVTQMTRTDGWTCSI